ncbi:aldehyde dehydrogenase [Pseudomonas gingeri]|uniref:aldehyde dehydrogenase n=1 Tax=Pseudomonas gingeri TaxID=117681 RepID=UPI0015B8152F|nr:aldehyde dehydrogenase [Pseudomonas gingeri]NWD51675.1 aldehyde dehydrogenase [Pseudomonas gingeri]
MSNTLLLINGKLRPASNGATFVRHDFVADTVATTAAAATLDDTASAVEAAAKAFVSWSRSGPDYRRNLLLEAARELLGLSAELTAAMARETGATQGWATFNIALGASILREAASLTTAVRGETIPSDMPGCFSMSIRQAAGVVLGIAPWNAPVILGVRAIATALACGNSVILKASEACPQTHSLIGQAFLRAGFPKGVVNVLSNAPEDAGAIVNALIDAPAVRRVNFTGSTRVGRLIAERCGRQLKPALLELGGKAPLLVLDDADLETAVDAAIFGAFMNQGQICMSTERVIVTPGIAEAFVEHLAQRAMALRADDPRKHSTPLGSVIDPQAAERVRTLIADALAAGATRLAGDDGQGVLIPANVIDQVTPAMRLYTQESFGPVVSVIRAKDQEDAIRIANDSEYGLSAAVFTRDISRAMDVAGRIRSGICHINGATVHDEPQAPFGGLGASGHGRFGGEAGVAEFTDLRWLTIQQQPRHYPL